MTVLAENLKTIRKGLHCSQMAISEVLEIGFRTYVRYEAGERDAPISVLIKIAKLGNISLDRLLTTKITAEVIKTPDAEKAPASLKKLDIVGGSLEEGRLIFKGIKDDYYVSTNKNERKLITLFRKMDRKTRENCLVDVEWIFNNSKRFTSKTGGEKARKVSRKVQKAQNAAKLKKMAKAIKKITVQG